MTYSKKVSVAQLNSAKKYQEKFTKVQIHLDKDDVQRYKRRAQEMGYSSFTKFARDAFENFAK